MKSDNHLTHTIAAASVLISLTGGCRAPGRAAVGKRSGVAAVSDEAPYRLTALTPSRAIGLNPADPYRVASTMSETDACALPPTLSDLNVCYSYAKCCGFATEVTPSGCGLAIADSRAVCECGFGPTNKVQCEQTPSGVRCKCE